MAIRVRRTRRQGVGKYKLKKAPWLDPHPLIPGTEPEKRVFALLYDLRIYFIYQGQVPEFEKGGKYYTMAIAGYKPDFVLPEYKLIIDPFSPFHHSLDAAVARDQRKVALYNMAGYAYYHPWAVASGVWTWDQYHNTSSTLKLGTRTVKFAVNSAGKRVGWEHVYQTKDGKLVTKDGKPLKMRTRKVTDRISLYQGVNADANSYRGINRSLHGTTTMGTHEMIMSIPEINAGPRYKLTDPRDKKAKQNPGYRIGEYVGAGASSVGAANRARAAGAQMGSTIRYGSRRTIRRS